MHEGQQKAIDNGPTSPVSPLASYPPPPPVEYRSRAPEFYGFVAWGSTWFLFVLYILWALLPDEYLIRLGMEWYPNREWSLLIPAYLMIVVLLVYLSYLGLAFAGTPALSDLSTVIDSTAHFPPEDERAPQFGSVDSKAIAELYDAPIGLVNRALYGPVKRKTD